MAALVNDPMVKKGERNLHLDAVCSFFVGTSFASTDLLGLPVWATAIFAVSCPSVAQNHCTQNPGMVSFSAFYAAYKSEVPC